MRFRNTCLVAFALAASAAAFAAPERSETEIRTALKNFRLETSSEFLGSAGAKTVVRVKLESGEVASALLAKGVHHYSLTLKGEIRGSALPQPEEFHYPLSGELVEGQPVSFSFLRALAPGSYEVEIDLGDGSRVYGKAVFPLDVPETGREFQPEMAPNDYSTLPSAEAVILAAPAPTSNTGLIAGPDAVPRVQIESPDREAPIGLIRLTAKVLPPVTKVDFYLDDKLMLSRTRPPYTVEIDLGKIPRRQTVRAAGYDAAGNLVDEDAWAINEGDAKLAVRILPLAGAGAKDGVHVRLAVQSIRGAVAKNVSVFLDERKVASFAHGPYEVVIPAAQYSAANYIRATAISEEGSEANDIHFIHGPNATAESVRVDVVQLHVSALDRAGHFVPGLAEKDFSVSEDGRPQKLLSFEVAENLPLNVGLVIDSSGSMRKAMDFVHSAGAALFRDMIHEKDRGFVIQFKEVPTLLAPPTGDVPKLVNAVLAAEAAGQTALYDSVVLGLYQFRATSGRKALVVITDGGDNHSWVDYDTMLRYIRTSGVPVYIIGVRIPFTEFGTRSKLKEIAGDTGGEEFLTSNPEKIPEIVRRIETELRSQYILSYRTDSNRPEGEFRQIKVAIDRPDIGIRTMRGYVP